MGGAHKALRDTLIPSGFLLEVAPGFSCQLSPLLFHGIPLYLKIKLTAIFDHSNFCEDTVFS